MDYCMPDFGVVPRSLGLWWRFEGWAKGAITFGATCDSFARMHSGTFLAGRGAIDRLDITLKS
jgi:hypothetical protein